MDIQLDRPANVRTRLGTSLRSRRRRTGGSVLVLAAQVLALGVLVGFLIGTATSPSPSSVLLLGAGTLGYALASFGLEHA